MKKQITCLLLALVMMSTFFTACGNQSNDFSEQKNSFQTTAKTTTEAPTVSNPIIPDPGAYFRLSRNEDGCFGADGDRYYSISYQTDLSYPQALHEYITLISDEKYQFELVHKYERPDGWSFTEYNYYFKYTGATDIPDLDTFTYDDAVCDLVVSISYFPAEDPGEYDHAYLSLNFNPDAPFELVDSGEHTAFPLRDLSYIY